MQVPLEATPHALRNPTLVKHATRRSILTFSFQRNDKYAGACRWKKTCGRQSLALLNVSHIQEIAHRVHVSYSVTRERGCTIDITNLRLHRREVTQGREREAVQKHTFAIFFRIPPVTYQDDGRRRPWPVLPLQAFWSPLVYRTFNRSSP